MFRLPQSHIRLSPHCNICFKHSIRQSHSVSAVSFLLETWNIQLLIIGFHKMKLKKTKFHCWIWLLRCCIILSENLAKKQKTIVLDMILQFHLLTSEWCSWRHLWMKSIRHKLQKLGQNPKEKEIPTWSLNESCLYSQSSYSNLPVDVKSFNAVKRIILTVVAFRSKWSRINKN